jgi:hypothetical protein
MGDCFSVMGNELAALHDAPQKNPSANLPANYWPTMLTALWSFRAIAPLGRTYGGIWASAKIENQKSLEPQNYS